MTENEILIRIANHQEQIAELETELANIRQEQIEEETLQNTYDTLFDGLKFTNTQETAIEIRLPMYYRANLFYKKTTEGITTIYVCSPLDGSMTGIVTEENFDDIMTTL